MCECVCVGYRSRLARMRCPQGKQNEDLSKFLRYLMCEEILKRDWKNERKKEQTGKKERALS